MTIRMTALAATALLGASLGHLPAARAGDPPPEGTWTGKGQLGYVGTQGNTDARSLNAALDMALKEAAWQHALHLGALYGQQSGITSAERWDAGWQSGYQFNAKLYGFGALRYTHDMFSGFQYQGSLTAGVGYKFSDSDTFKLAGQLGAGFRQSRPELIDKTTNPPQVYRTPLAKQNDAVFTAGLDYWQALTKTTTLTDKLVVESGSSNTLTTNALALTVKMSDKLALGLGYNLQHNSSPPAAAPGNPPLKHLDSTETVNLVYSF